MRIHGDALTETMIRDAAQTAGVYLHRNTLHGSRKRARAFDVILAGSGRTGTRYGMDQTYTAATWDEWGIFLAALFTADESITIPRVYEDGEHFRWVTAGRFDRLTVADQHIRHRWEYGRMSATGSYSVAQCKGCTATNRWLLGGRTWADFRAPNDDVFAPTVPTTGDDAGKYASHGRYAEAFDADELLDRIDALING